MTTRLLAAALVVLAGCGPKPVPPPEADAGVVELIPTTNAEHQLMLTQLGFTTDVGARTGPKGEVLPERWHPLKTRYAAFAPRKELYLAGGPTLANQSELFLDDKAAAHAALPLSRYPDQTWLAAEFKNGIAVDTDDDGLDEVFIVYFAQGSQTLKYLLLDPDDMATPVTGVIDVGLSSFANLDHFAQPSLAVGDVDRDGKPDIAIGFGRLYVVSNLHDGQLTVVTRSFDEFNDVGVAIGNIDKDPADELVVTHTETRLNVVRGFYEIFDGSLSQPLESGELRVQDVRVADHFFGESRVAIGDVDGDRIGDIVFHGRRVSPGDNAWHLFMMQYHPTVATPSDRHFTFRTLLHYTGLAYATSPRMLALPDVDGDGVAEFFGWSDVLSLQTDGTLKVKYVGVPGLARAAVANVDTDRRDDLLVAANGRLEIWGLDVDSQDEPHGHWRGLRLSRAGGAQHRR